jgi:hypothetical protein
VIWQRAEDSRAGELICSIIPEKLVYVEEAKIVFDNSLALSVNDLLIFIGVLPGLHGLLITTLGTIHYRRTQHSKTFLRVELIAGCLLIVAWLLIIANIWLEWQSLVSSVCGLWLAAIATLLLDIVAIVKAVKAFKNKRNWVLSTVGLLLNLLALIIYLICALWFSWLLLLMLVGGSYR